MLRNWLTNVGYFSMQLSVPCALRVEKKHTDALVFFFNTEEQRFTEKIYATGLFRVCQRRSFNSVSPLLVREDIKRCGIPAGNSLLMAAFNSSSSISLLLMVMIKSFCSISGLYSSSSLRRTSNSLR